MPKTTTPTPETTPIPGGGSWRWDIALPGWVPNPTDVPDPEAPEATADLTESPKE